MPRGVAPRIGRFAFVVTSVLSLYFLVTLAQVWNTGRNDAFRTGDRKADAIVVLGAAQYDGRPSPQLRARLDHAIGLWKRTPAAVIVVTGGKQFGDRFTEAEAGRSYLVDRGVPSAVIVMEPRSTSTYESLLAVRDELNLRGAGSVVLVSDPYHVLRAVLVARELGMDAEVSATRTGVTRGGAAFERNVRESFGVMIGRVVGFRQLESWLQ